MEAFKVNVDLMLLHMDHQYKGLHLHSFQMEQTIKKLTANQGYHWNTTDRALGE